MGVHEPACSGVKSRAGERRPGRRLGERWAARGGSPVPRSLLYPVSALPPPNGPPQRAHVPGSRSAAAVLPAQGSRCQPQRNRHQGKTVLTPLLAPLAGGFPWPCASGASAEPSAPAARLRLWRPGTARSCDACAAAVPGAGADAGVAQVSTQAHGLPRRAGEATWRMHAEARAVRRWMFNGRAAEAPPTRRMLRRAQALHSRTRRREKHVAQRTGCGPA
jgi:hypothetical protein